MNKATVFIFIACCAVSVLSLAENEKKSKPPATMSPPGEFVNNSTTASPTTNATTPEPTTTAKPAPTTKPTTTTAKPAPTTKPTTTTAKPAPTTAKTTTKPTTTTAKPAPTTAKTTTKPTTTTQAPTAPPPTPAVNLTVGNYNVTSNNKTCLKAVMAVQIRLATPKENGTFIVQPSLTTAEGSCSETTANLTLSFKQGYITFLFNKSAAENTVTVSDLTVKLSYPLSKGCHEYMLTKSSLQLFAAKVGHSYSCKSDSIYMGANVSLVVTQDRMQAFNLTNNDFGYPDHCAADKPDYRIAIAVGVTLLVLIVIVVVAYLLGRRKRTDGYQSL